MITKELILEILDDTIEAENDNFAELPSSPTIEGKNEAAERLVKFFALHIVSSCYSIDDKKPRPNQIK